MPEFDIEAAIKLVADIGLRPAARHYDLKSHTTLASRIKTYKAKQVRAPEPVAEPNPEPQSEPSYGGRWATIRRNENHARSLLGLPPLTDEEWAIGKLKMEECEKAMEHFWKPT
jgi:hypothetical protein